MQSGLLWFDNDPGRGVIAKVEAAACRYREKFGAAPDTCYVNRAAFEGAELELAPQGVALRVIPARDVLAHHFWIGVEEPTGAG